MNTFKQLLSCLPSSLWFIPSLTVVTSISIALALIEADAAGNGRWLARWTRLLWAQGR